MKVNNKERTRGTSEVTPCAGLISNALFGTQTTVYAESPLTVVSTEMHNIATNPQIQKTGAFLIQQRQQMVSIVDYGLITEATAYITSAFIQKTQ